MNKIQKINSKILCSTGAQLAAKIDVKPDLNSNNKWRKDCDNL